MPQNKSLPMYVVRQTAKGHTYYYFRWHGVYRRLPDDPTSEEFRREYARALASTSAEAEQPIIAGSVRALIRDYKQSPEFRSLAPKTQSDYARMLDHLRPIGDFQADNIRRQHIIRLRNKLPTARTMDLFVSVVSRLYSVGIDLGYTDRNPAARIERLNDPESYQAWPREVRERFEASEMPQWMRTAYMLGLWTAQREGDVLRLARNRFDGEGFLIRQGRPESRRGKGRKGRVVTLWIPAAKPLLAYIEQTQFTGLLFVADEQGRPIEPDHFRKAFRAHLDSLGLRDYHFHGLRHTTATALAESGATDREIMSITGHLTEQMVRRYTHSAEQKRMAAHAIKKLERGLGSKRERVKPRVRSVKPNE
ncbi:MAG: hypothetical protein DIU79_13865 [Actinobacteria bacterium]|nr:MAG: hypothetical protein DIU79_13865 [Actinomycetota bacterium]